MITETSPRSGTEGLRDHERKALPRRGHPGREAREREESGATPSQGTPVHDREALPFHAAEKSA